MQKTRLSYLFIAFTLAAFGLLFILAYYQIHRPIPQQSFKAQHLVLIVDFNSDKILNEKELLTSQDAVLAIRSQNRTGKPSDLIFNSLDALKRLDFNKDKRLDKADPMFPYLELIFFKDGGKNRQSMSLSAAGINAIAFTQNLKDNNSYKNNSLIGYAIKTNQQKLEIRLVPISFD